MLNFAIAWRSGGGGSGGVKHFGVSSPHTPRARFQGKGASAGAATQQTVPSSAEYNASLGNARNNEARRARRGQDHHHAAGVRSNGTGLGPLGKGDPLQRFARHLPRPVKKLTAAPQPERGPQKKELPSVAQVSNVTGLKYISEADYAEAELVDLVGKSVPWIIHQNYLEGKDALLKAALAPKSHFRREWWLSCQVGNA